MKRLVAALGDRPWLTMGPFAALDERLELAPIGSQVDLRCASHTSL